jgi:hypothetical protein
MPLNFICKPKAEKPPWPTADEAAAAFHCDPAKCLFGGQGHEYLWDEKNIRDMNFSFQGRQIAFVHGITLYGTSIVKVLMFAVEIDLLERGIGFRLATWLADEFKVRYGARAIRFEPRNNTSYPAFFTKLGATPVLGSVKIDRIWPDWIWRF